MTLKAVSLSHLHFNFQQTNKERNENSAVATGLEKVSFHSSTKECNAKECSNYCTTARISYVNKVMFKILQASLQQYVYRELSGVQVGFRKGIGTRDWIANICWMIEKAREFQKNMYFCFIDYTKAFDCVIHNKPWKILKERGMLDTSSFSWENCMWVRKQQFEPVQVQSWMFIAKTDAEAKAPILWPLDTKSQFIRKGLDVGKRLKAEEENSRGWDD